MEDFHKTTFIFLRHGEPVGGKIFRGSTDDPLTEQGWLQMQESATHLAIDEIVSSPLKRCIEYAATLQKEKGCHLTVMDDIQELHLGDWEGLSAEQVEKRDATALAEFWAKPYNYTPPNGETLNDFEARIINAWNTLSKEYTSIEQAKTVLVVCHAGVMMMLLKFLLGFPIENILCIKLNYASKVTVEVYDERYNLKPQIYIEHGYPL